MNKKENVSTWLHMNINVHTLTWKTPDASTLRYRLTKTVMMSEIFCANKHTLFLQKATVGATLQF